MSEKEKKQKCYANRELSWLKFNERVLDEAASHHVPLCERMAFFSIFQSNLDEFFMVRVGALYDQMLADREARENKTWMTSEEQLKAIFEKTRIISQRRDYIYKQYMEELSEQGVKLLNFMDMLPEDKLFLEKYFENECTCCNCFCNCVRIKKINSNFKYITVNNSNLGVCYNICNYDVEIWN